LEDENIYTSFDAVPIGHHETNSSNITQCPSPPWQGTEGERANTIRSRGKRKRYPVKKEEDPEEALKRSFKKDGDDDKDPKRHPLRGMSGRRHSGFRSVV
jgi:hypothetical protein